MPADGLVRRSATGAYAELTDSVGKSTKAAYGHGRGTDPGVIGRLVSHDWFERVRLSFQPSAVTGGERCRHPPIVVPLAGQTALSAVISCNEEQPATALAAASAVL